jgi:hypothetical protein
MKCDIYCRLLLHLRKVFFYVLWHCLVYGKYQRFGEMYATVFSAELKKTVKLDNCVRREGDGMKLHREERSGQKKPGIKW